MNAGGEGQGPADCAPSGRPLFRDAFDRLDRLHRQYPMPQTCRRCERHWTTSTDGVCHVCKGEGKW